MTAHVGTILGAVAAILLTAMGDASAEPRRPDGVWLRDDGNARVRIAPCGNDICATNLWIRDTSKGEEAGDVLIMSLQRKSDTILSGSAYDLKRDRRYVITMEVGENAMTTRGCILAGLLCTKVAWSSATE